MAEISVYFLGICTFMQDTAAGMGFDRRVVLVNAKSGANINGNPIPPHIPTLRIAPHDLVVNGVPASSGSGCILEWELNGCKLEIVDTIDDLKHDDSFECCIPQLSKLTHGLGAPSPEVVIAGESDKASCYFELTGGTLTAGLVGAGAAASLLHARTAGETPVLRIRKFHTDEVQEFHLRDGAEIAIMNVGVEGMTSDDPNDFLLHYEVAKVIPADAVVPLGPAPCCRELKASYIVPQLGVGPGCSNSSFP